MLIKIRFYIIETLPYIAETLLREDAGDGEWYEHDPANSQIKKYRCTEAERIVFLSTQWDTVYTYTPENPITGAVYYHAESMIKK